jgi:hypothetical protein
VHATHEKRACRPGEEAGNGAVQQVVSPASLHPRTELGPIEPTSVAAARCCDNLAELGNQGHGWMAVDFNGKGSKGKAGIAVALVLGTFGDVSHSGSLTLLCHSFVAGRKTPSGK